MLELGNFNFQFFFPGSGRLVFKSLAAAILKAGVTLLLELFYPLVDLLLADVELEGCLPVIPAIRYAIFSDLNSFLNCGWACFFHAAPS